MRIAAHAKINWTLDITGERSDGYHLMDMIMQKIELHDTIELEEAEELTLSIEGNETLAAEADNLILKAARALRGDRPLGAVIHLTKRIPTGAGLGGGSADAAAALIALNELWGSRLSIDELCRIGEKIGADIPYCLHDTPARVSGIGQIIQPYSIETSYPLVLLQPAAILSTKEIFHGYHNDTAQHPDNDAFLSALLQGDSGAFKTHGANALEQVSFELIPELAVMKQRLYDTGAVYAAMTGSGSVMFGVFDSMEKAAQAYQMLSNEFETCILTATC